MWTNRLLPIQVYVFAALIFTETACGSSWSKHMGYAGGQKLGGAYYVRGGSTAAMNLEAEENNNDNDDADNYEQEGETELEEDEESKKRRLTIAKYRMDQQMLMQLRSTILSEAIAKRGIPMTTILDVSTTEGEKPPETVDWDCAVSTEEDTKSCLFSFDAEPNTKVIAPINTQQWITLSALNRLRRTDPTKVEPMWHSQYAILSSWFGDDSQYSILQHTGIKGYILSQLLDKSIVLRGLMTLSVFLVALLNLPILEYLVNRMLVSSTLWLNWAKWARIVHAALPLQLLVAQMSWKFFAKSIGRVEAKIRDYVVEMECALLEEKVPLTVGPGSNAL